MGRTRQKLCKASFAELFIALDNAHDIILKKIERLALESSRIGSEGALKKSEK